MTSILILTLDFGVSLTKDLQRAAERLNDQLTPGERLHVFSQVLNYTPILRLKGQSHQLVAMHLICLFS